MVGAGSKATSMDLSTPPSLAVILNIISIAWLVSAVVFSTFPSTVPVTLQTLNYSTVVMAGWLSFGAVYYFSEGWKKFGVPLVDVRRANSQWVTKQT